MGAGSREDGGQRGQGDRHANSGMFNGHKTNVPSLLMRFR
jgi:hypothetical protein